LAQEGKETAEMMYLGCTGQLGCGGGLGAGPDPAAMSCADIEKGYLLNKKLAKTRKKHHKQHAVRVKELEPFYKNCQKTGFAVGGPDQDSQAVIDAVFGGGGSVGGTVKRGQVSQSVVSTAPPSLASSAVGLAALIAASGALIYLAMRSAPSIRKGTKR